ncbi:sugar transferase [Rhodococcus sp. IEGM 1351]|uniref:sugar transferase n=1 Tax=Rhodococcus sp. IEGM 1351 TaxID=3047089 RepID=UPI0024B7CC54|nr:sugar transferase [Rhodococcus sp. IEGM 1351]MDI9935381.1 sugar transferase [Rhodococcus sp. IEGM 1351]
MVTAFDVSPDSSRAPENAAAFAAEEGGSDSRREWQAAYIRRLLISDTLIVIAAVALAQWVRFGDSGILTTSGMGHDLSYTLVSALLIVAWLTTLTIFRTRTVRVIGSGPDEYRRIFVSTVRLFGFIAMLALLFRLDLARLYLAIAFPVGLVALMASRWAWRQVIARKRSRGEFQTSVLVVGNERAVRNLAESFARGTADGYRVVGVCIPGHSGDHGDKITVAGRDIPVLGSELDVIDSLEFCHADTVAVTATEHLGHEGMRALAWDLEPHDVDLVVSPGMMDVSGPRLSMRPVAGLPLIHVEKPQYHGAQKFSKLVFDMIFAISALVLTSPVMTLAALTIKLTSKGPVFYKSERVGLDGRPFPMLKFRSMVVDADKQVAALMTANEGAGVLFKIREDPRVTRVGGVLRKYSLDELPQFLNVLRREMSVVGPRPPLRREVEAYDGTVRRRLLVKPGITGLWQVSGRSDLSWEETVRLDLSYVENWSMMGDVLIIGKTVRAVAVGDGAY